jgi:hypothetical protein
MLDQVMRRLMPMATLLCLLLSRSATAAEPNVITKAQAVGNPIVFAIADNDQGAAQDFDAAQAIRDLVVGTDWTLFDNDTLLITNKGKPVLASAFVKEGSGFFWVHARQEKYQVDGEVYYNAEKKDGFGQLYWTLFSTDGRSSMTANVYTALRFVP